MASEVSNKMFGAARKAHVTKLKKDAITTGLWMLGPCNVKHPRPGVTREKTNQEKCDDALYALMCADKKIQAVDF